MPYTELDDRFYDHLETQLRSHAAIGVMVKALSYCTRHLTDGYIPRDTMLHLARGRGGKAALEELQKVTAAGPHWLRQDREGFYVDRYFDATAPWGRQRSRAEVDAMRAKNRRRKADERDRQRQGQLPWNGRQAEAGVTP